LRTGYLLARATLLLAAAVLSWHVSAQSSCAAEPETAEPSTQPRISDEDLQFFNAKILPVLAHSCYECHSHAEETAEAGLYLDSRAAWMRGGDSNRSPIVPGDPEKSKLILALRHNVEGVEGMPPEEKLSASTIKDFEEWIRRGAPDPREENAKAGTLTWDEEFAARRKAHWAWQPITVVPPGKTNDAAWAASEIDRYILAKLEAAGLQPAPQADKRVLLRRVTYDLIGLPPTEEEINAFVADETPDAFAKVVDRLLASPHFGERWGRHWLDLMRYAESYGHEYDFDIPTAYEYRDYVIRAFNADVSYKQFIHEHIAGDLIEPRVHPTEKFNESLIGTFFWFLGEEKHSPVDPLGDEATRQENQIDVMTRAFLASSVACARCHDHKFDPIGTADYYALKGFLQSSSMYPQAIEQPLEFRRIADEVVKLDGEQQTAAASAFGELQTPRVAKIANYLTASRDVLLGLDGATSASVAAKHILDAPRLEAYVAYLRRAAGDANDPLHAWAAIASRPEEEFTKVRAEMAAKFKQLDEAALENGKRFELIQDYSTMKDADFLPVGRAFAEGWRRVGEPNLGETAAQPVKAFQPLGEARNDALRLGMNGCLKTVTFEIKSKNLGVKVRGAAAGFLVVDSHRVVYGPLHGSTKFHVNGGNDFTWQRINVEGYIGHRVHLEFTSNSPFALAEVRQGDGPLELRRPNAAVADAIANANAGSFAELAAEFQQLVAMAVEAGGRNALAGHEKAAALAELANWTIANDALLEPAKPPADGDALLKSISAYRTKRTELTNGLPPSARTVHAMTEGSHEDEHIYVRGNHANPGPLAPKRLMPAIVFEEQSPITERSGRLELAKRITADTSPAARRVIVNRIWQHMFGRGIVATADNFGKLGVPPTHPELLDYLAEEFGKNDWSIKRMIRTIALSKTYQMSSKPSEAGFKVDPKNDLLYQQRIRRLEGEIIRDAILAVSGRLDRTQFGPGVPVHLTPFMSGRGRPKHDGPVDGNGRRTIYIQVRRNFLSPMMLAFGTPIPFTAMGERENPNVPAQALILMNNPFVVAEAKRWSDAVAAQAGAADDVKIKGMYVRSLGREPNATELADALAFIRDQGTLYGQPGHAQAWADLCHVMFNTKEFIHVY
jgi:hypothetical protein